MTIISHQLAGWRTIDLAAERRGRAWMWTLGVKYHKEHTPAHGYAATREAAMAAFAKSWRRES